MLISGIQPFTVLDYPDKLACIVFTPGCTFRCGYCHNPEFVLPERIIKLKDSFIPESALWNFLEERRGLLDGVVITGGEPTLTPDLIQVMKKIKSLGFSVKLDTNGNRPDMIRRTIAEEAIDYMAMDIKTSLEGYPALVGKGVRVQNIAESVSLLKEGIVDYEFRSTLIQEVHSATVLEQMNKLVAGARRLYLQSFRPAVTLRPEFSNYHPFSSEEMSAIAAQFKKKVERVVVRCIFIMAFVILRLIPVPIPLFNF